MLVRRRTVDSSWSAGFIDAKQPRQKVAADFGVSVETVGKWVRRWRAGGEPALHDRSSAPAHPPHRLPPERVAEIERLRRQRMSSPAIARQLGIPISTVTNVLRRLGLNRLKALEPPQPILRYERERPGELLHLDTKKLGRIGGLGHRITGRRTGVINRHLGIGWEYLHVCVDDSWPTNARRAPSPSSAVPSRLVRLLWRQRRARQLLPQPPLPPSLQRRRYPTPAHKALYATYQWRAERFIQTVLRECAYARPFHSSPERADALPRWTHAYNVHRPHTALTGKPPISRLDQNNLLADDS